MMAGEAHFFPSDADYVAALRAHYRSRFRGKRFWRLVGLVAVVALAMAVLIRVIDPDPVAALATSIGGIAGGLGAIAIFMLLGRLLLPRWARRLYRQQRTLHQDHHVEWDDAGIRWRTESANSRFVWNEFHGWREGPDTVMIYLNDHLFHFIPLRALDSAAAGDLRATLRTHGPTPL